MSFCFNTNGLSRLFSVGGALLLALGVVSGCALDRPSKQVIKDCVLPSDQSGTILGHWKATPIPIAFYSGDFSAEEISIITGAADTWNTFYAASLGMSAIDYGGSSPRISSAARPSQICSQGIMNGTTFTGKVVIYKDAQWPYTNAPDAIAMTPTCSIPGKPMNYLYNAMIDVNYQNFFVSGKKIPDLKSILIHEFGHLMGLNHSCEKATKTGTPNCTDPAINPLYLSAIMFPVFSFTDGHGEVKQGLNDNDQGRANCLYSTGTTN